MLIYNLAVLRSSIVALKMETENLTKIEQGVDLDKISNILKISDVRKEITQLEMLFEKSITPKIKNVDLYIDFKKLVKQINALVHFIETKRHRPVFQDAKPFLIKILGETSQNIENILKQIDDLKF